MLFCFLFFFESSFCFQDQQAALHFAAYKGFKDIVKILLQHGGSNVNLQDQVLIFFSFFFFIIIIHLNFFFVKSGQTALHKAAFGGFEEVVKHLIEHGSNVNLRDEVF